MGEGGRERGRERRGRGRERLSGKGRGRGRAKGSESLEEREAAITHPHSLLFRVLGDTLLSVTSRTVPSGIV